MNILKKLITRIKFRKSIKRDESVNVVDSMAKARSLFKELSVKAHPDRNPGKEEIAEELFKRIQANKFNYAELLSLKSEVEEKLKH